MEEGDQGTFGRFTSGALDLCSGELPERANRPNASRIPAGTYICTFTDSPRFGRRLYLLGDVPGRSGVRIHPANFVGDEALGWKSELDGCIALGKSVGEIGGQKALLSSKKAVQEMEEFFGGEPFTLEIRDI